MANHPKFVLFLLLALTMFTRVPGSDGAMPARENALSALASDDLARRREAYAALGEVGLQQDLPLLFAALYDRDRPTRQVAENSIWRIWGRSGDASADQIYARGVAQMERGLLQPAVTTFTELIESHPTFAEAWNKRATVYFLLGENDRSIADCEQVLKRNPQHFGALSGYGQLMVRKGNFTRALEYFERALTINPNMAGLRAIIERLKAQVDERQRKFI